ncbi:uncharacterized protein LOC110448537 [Mizuhopecten yessoensis]|uniref:Uncharacterized protein n=1 Tax=Mizuhopecten yessoensis TaxID=6573 RepID=A0A210QSV6_MIZYE|nr:uncharacterized protein LOC110448537 [Mizuhopecten yessoensis]OWF51821.1 hypothetical protein KP79_PYT05631 [Mizuhopecten yessoensis]
MATLSAVLLFLVVLSAAGRRRPCADDCDCRMSKGHRCVYRLEKNNLVHCSLKDRSADGGCFCLRSCVMMDGTMIRKRKTISSNCNNCTCVTPTNNKATCVSSLVDCRSNIV